MRVVIENLSFGGYPFGWSIGISTFRCSVLDQNVVLSQQRAQLTHRDIYRPGCIDNTAQASSEPFLLSLHPRERLGKRLGKRLVAGVCFLVACAALHGRHCGVCSAANAMAHASGLWAWRVLALAWQVPALAWQVPWQVLCSKRHGTRHWLVAMACAGACMACAGACMACAGACMACAGACMAGALHMAGAMAGACEAAPGPRDA